MRSIYLETKKHYLKVRFPSSNHLKDLKLIASLNINLYEIQTKSNYVYLKITKSDYKRLSKYLKLEKIQDYGIYKLQNEIKNHILSIYLFAASLIFIFLISHLTANVYVIHSNPILRETITEELAGLGIKKFSIQKDYATLQKIKETILNKYPDSLEWLEIIPIGMNYEVRLQDKVLTNTTETNKYCHIVAAKEGMITRIISSDGEIIKNVNNYVRVGDIIVSGAITFNEEVKNNVCANAKVYAETWYTISVTMPKIKTIKTYTGNERSNFLLTTPTDQYKILRSRLNPIDSENKLLLKVGDYKFYYQKEKEYTIEKVNLTDEEVLKAIDQEIQNKLSIKLKDDCQILSQKVLKKTINDSTIYVEAFVTVEEQIGKEQIYIPE